MAACQSHTKVAKVKARSFFNGLPRCQKIPNIDPSMPSVSFRKATQTLVQKQAVLLIQLRTGHVLVKKYFSTIGKAETLRCPVCNSAD